MYEIISMINLEYKASFPLCVCAHVCVVMELNYVKQAVFELGDYLASTFPVLRGMVYL